MRFLVAVAGFFILGGCSLVPPVAALDSATVMGTKKTMADHLISVASGKDCSTVRSGLGQSYCKEDELNPEPAIYCYRTLGAVTCYDRPDPHRGRHQKLGDNTHNIPSSH